jgi:endonuclease G
MGTVAAPGSTSALAEQLREQEQRQQDLAAGRARDRADERAPALGGLDGDDIAAVNDPLRVARRLDRVSRYLTGRDPDSVPSDAPPAALVADAAARLALPQAPEVLLERVINQPDFLAVRYLEGGHVAQRTVGRIVIRGADGKVAGYGTGFLVSAHLLLTNHHVLPSAQVAAASVLELDFQRSLAGSLLPVVELALAPDRFFVADPTLDFAPVEVAGAPEATAPFGWCRLTDAQGTVVVGECVTIVQHPRGREKEVVLRENKLVDIPEQVLHYLTDTEPGSSGSPVFNDQWEVIALHHASVPGTTEGDSPGYLNEGIRISRILRHLREAGLDGQRRARVDALGTAPSPHGGRPTAAGQGVAEHDGTAPVVPGPLLQSATAAPAPDAPAPDAPAPPAPGPVTPAPVIPVTVDIPLRLTLSLTLGDSAAAPPPARATPRTQGGLVQPRAAVEALAIDPDYSTRGGYDPAFLEVPLPLPGVGSNAAVASAELRYHHFSVVMHRARRLALLAAVNIDGGTADAQPRSDDRWILDPRLPRSEQTGADVYADNDLDRGHLVRRLDPAWGPLARAANDDTFHYTNSAPQHHAFNAGSTLWLGLEEYVLGTARRDRLRVSVVSGPVLAPDDPPYRGTLLPRQFYKVVAVVDDRDRLVVTGYVLGQDSFLPSVLTEAAFGAYRTFQVRVATIAALTGLDLGAYVAADPLGAQEATVAAHALRSYADIVLGA